MLKAALAEFERMEVPFGRYEGSISLGDALCGHGDLLAALEAYATAIDLQRQVGFTGQGAHLLDALAEIALLLEDAERAAFLLGAASSWDRIHGREQPVVGEPEQRRVARAVRARLATDSWSGRFGAGSRCSTTEAHDAAAVAVVELAARVSAPLPSGISTREADVLRLLSAGLSNTEIAERLVLSPRTVGAHLRSVYAKLGVRTRTAAVHEARRLGLR
jgi:ATP/maltotriose-dependent transcriptional regulator MalT